MRIRFDYDNRAYLTLWLQLDATPKQPLSAVSQIVMAGAAIAGLKKIRSVSAYAVPDRGTADNGYFEPIRSGVNRAYFKNVSVVMDSDNVLSSANPSHLSEIIFDHPRPGTKHPIADYLLHARYLQVNSGGSSLDDLCYAPMISVSLRAELFDRDARRVVECVDAMLNSASRLTTIAHGACEISFGVESCNGRYYDQTIQSDCSYDRALWHAIWMHSGVSPSDAMFRVSWCTIVGTRLIQRAKLSSSTLRQYETATAPDRTVDTSFGHYARRLPNGEFAFYASLDPFVFVAEEPLGYHVNAFFQGVFFPAAWLHRRLREAGVLV